MNPSHPLDNGQTTTAKATRSAPLPGGEQEAFRKVGAGQSDPSGGSPGDKGGRDPRGRFTAGNKGGPGNPFARRTAGLRQALLEAVTEDDLQAIVRQLIQKAREGDVSAARLVLSYTVGKPDKAVDPDTLDQQEWQTFQEGAVANQDFLGLLGHLQAPLACTILRALLPHLQQVVAQQLKEQLQEPVPSAETNQEQDQSQPPRDDLVQETARPKNTQPRQTPARPSGQAKSAPRQTGKTERPAVQADREFLEAEESDWLDFLQEVTGQDFRGPAGIGDQQGQSTPEGDEGPSPNGLFPETGTE